MPGHMRTALGPGVVDNVVVNEISWTLKRLGFRQKMTQMADFAVKGVPLPPSFYSRVRGRKDIFPNATMCAFVQGVPASLILGTRIIERDVLISISNFLKRSITRLLFLLS